MVVRGSLVSCGLLIGLTIAHASGLERTTDSAPSKSGADLAAARVQSPYQRQDTWYEFVLKQFNPNNVDYGNWLEQQRRSLIERRLKNPDFLYSVWTTIALILAASISLKQRIDHRRALSITAEMMADLYNQDAYSREVAQQAIERYNRHIEHCNRAVEMGDNRAGLGAASKELEQLRTELMRVAEERDIAIRDRDLARAELRRKSEILADMSVRLDSTTSKSAASPAKTTPDLRGTDARLVTHINTLQEQLYSERNNNRRLRGG
jgi:hypothetical protein